MADLARLSRQRRAREQEGRFVLDGPVLLADAVAAGIEVHDVFVDPDATTRPEVADAVAAAVGSGARAWAVQGGLRGHVEPRTPNGVAAVARTPDAAPDPDPTARAALHLVLVAVGDPGNAGTLLRTAEAVGATSVVLADGSVDPWSPKVVRASAGSVLRVPVGHGSAAEVLAALGEAGVQRVATAGAGGLAPQDLDLAGPVALVLGSEAHGLPADLDAAVDARASLPMAGRVESLNVAVAGSVLAYEVLRQRAGAGPR
ncbi:RNA methyltransferase [Iamia majanohamensis]|uniref:RNA methyltransferase n=1 Tax=Iamia majanohamensis TaxID=467976 RepID=A0AAE9Y2S1_9ACTN|nr:RNA methyltransferase [Iamia majanohamensis]WCO65120.1 RNA methyltransferase [Iamia majanohamensis]